MKKIKLFKVFVFFIIGLLSLVFVTNLENNVAIGATNTDSEYVNTVTDLEKTNLLGGVSLYEQKMSSLLNGDSGKIFQEHFVQWVDLDNYDNGVKLVTWTKQNADSWNAATTKICAQDWEAHHPGWIVVAGVNGDFFQNSGTITWEPTNNFMADGDMYRADYVGGHRKVIGISDDNEIIVGDPEISGLYLQLMSSEGEVIEQFPIASYNTVPKETGINLYTKDMIESHDLTGYTVYVGKYTMCRISNGNNQTVFVKGSIQYARPGTTDEKPRQIREVTTEDGGTKQEITREFYLATKDSNYEQKLQNGTLVRCQHNYEGNWSNVTQSVGFIHQMLVDGKSQFQKSTDSFIYTDHPRTFIGFKADGTPVLMVVDGRGKTAAEKNYGVSLFEGAEIMKLAGCVNAYNLDGGGSSTLIVRNNEGGFDVVNRPSDGSERSTGNAIFLVMRDPAVESKLGNATPTTITIERKNDAYSQSVENLTVKVDGKTYLMEGNAITIEGLKENTSYDVEISYEIEGETCKSSIKAQTK
ncbi:MAG: phosphodiester glycosidase family protein, partial [Staphylococcus sp.]|nr:phosphodiester glycosidase family protein [Staphylococcus sp.]